MNKNKIIFWISTGIIVAMMLMSGVMYFTSAEAIEGFKHAGFPDYFRKELGIAKILGVLALLIPMVPKNVKEWTYAGFGITFISASIAHLSSGDPMMNVLMPLVFLGILAVSYIFKNKF